MCINAGTWCDYEKERPGLYTFTSVCWCLAMMSVDDVNIHNTFILVNVLQLNSQNQEDHFSVTGLLMCISSKAQGVLLTLSQLKARGEKEIIIWLEEQTTRNLHGNRTEFLNSLNSG